MSLTPLESNKEGTPREVKEAEDLYERGLYRQALEVAQKHGFFAPDAGSEALVMAGRLAGQMGAPRLSRKLFLRAWRQDPAHPRACYYFGWTMLEVRGPWEVWSRIKGLGEFREASPDLRSDLLALRARAAAMLRDFKTADYWLAEAETLSPRDPWLCVERSHLLELQDKYEEAWDAVQRAFQWQPVFRPAVQSAAHLLELRNRDVEAIALLEDAAGRIECSAIWAQLAQLQTELGRHADARRSLDRYAELCPLMEKDVARWLAARRADLCYFLGEFDAAMLHAREVEDDFYREFAERLAGSKPEERRPMTRRRLLPVAFVRQHHMTCAPATLSAISRFWEQPAEHLALAEAICYDGTPAHSERAWAEQHGWSTREFQVTGESARALIDRGVPFTLTTSEATSAHLQAVIGYDHFRDTLLVRDPFLRHHVEFHTAKMLERYRSTGPRGMAMVPRARAELLAQLELPQAALHDQLHEVHAALARHDRSLADRLLGEMRGQAPDHRLTLTAQRALAGYDANPVESLAAVDRLLELFPGDGNLQLAQLSCRRQLWPRHARLARLETLCAERTTDPALWVEFASELGEDAREHARAERLLRRARRFRPADARNFYLTANILWSRRDYATATELYRFATCLDDKNESLAAAYFNASRFLKQTREALAFLSDRFQRFGKASSQPGRTLFWAYQLLDQTTAAFAALESALEWRPEDGDLQLYAADAYARSGEFNRAAALLESARGKARETVWLRTAATLSELRGEAASALKLWQQVLSLEPLSMDANRSLAQLVAETQGQAAALKHLEAVCQRFPHHFALHQLWHEWCKQETASAREAVARKLVEINPADAWAHRELVLILGGKGEFEEAARLMRRAFELSPYDPSNPSVEGWLFRSSGRLDEARAAYRKAIELSVDNGHAIEGLLALCNSLAERKEALAFVERELVRQVVFGEGLLAFRDVAAGILEPQDLLKALRLALKERPDLWHAWSAVIRQLTSLHQLEEALALAREATARFPLLPRVWMDLARVHQARLDHAAEVQALEQAVQVNPAWGEAVRELSEALERANRLSAARDLMERAVLRSPLDAHHHGVLADLLWKGGEQARAIELAQKAIRLNPGYEWAWRALNAWSEATGQPQLAVEMARELTRRRPGEARSWIFLAEMLTRPEDLNERLSAVEEAIRRNPRNPNAYDLQAFVLAEAKRFDEALAACHPAGWPGPLPIELRAREAWVIARRGDLPDAIERMKKVLADHPGYFWGVKQLADWLWTVGAREESLQAAETMARLAPLDPVPLGYAGDAKRSMGKRPEAKADFHRALELDPGYFFAGFSLFDMQLEEGDLDAAGKTLSSIRANGQKDAIQHRKARLAMRRNDATTAIDSLRALCHSKSVAAAVIMEIGEGLIQRGFVGMTEKLCDGLLEAENVNPAVGTLWIRCQAQRRRWWIQKRINQLLARGELGRQAVVAYLEYISEEWQRYGFHRDFVGPYKCRFHFWRLFRAHQAWLREDDQAWGKLGYAFLCQSRYRRVCRWLGDWASRKQAEPWMLFNLMRALQARGIYAEADKIARHALQLPTRDQTRPMYELWVALEDALTGRVEAARAALASLKSETIPDGYKTMQAVIQLLLNWQEPGCKPAVNAHESKILKTFLQQFRWNRAARKAFHRSLWLATRRSRRPWPVLWGYFTLQSPMTYWILLLILLNLIRVVLALSK